MTPGTGESLILALWASEKINVFFQLDTAVLEGSSRGVKMLDKPCPLPPCQSCLCNGATVPSSWYYWVNGGECPAGDWVWKPAQHSSVKSHQSGAFHFGVHACSNPVAFNCSRDFEVVLGLPSLSQHAGSQIAGATDRVSTDLSGRLHSC